MARIIPDGWRELEVTGGAQHEIETLAVLTLRGLTNAQRARQWPLPLAACCRLEDE